MAKTILMSHNHDGVIVTVIFLAAVSLTASAPLLKCNQIGNECITITSLDNQPPNRATYTIGTESLPPPCER